MRNYEIKTDLHTHTLASTQYDADLSVDKTVSILYAGEVWKEAVNGGTVDDAIKTALPLVKFIAGKGGNA